MTKAGLDIFRRFFQSERAGGLILIACTAFSLLLANSGWGLSYAHFWHLPADLSFSVVELNHSIEQWINDGLMAVFFLLVGLEIKRELYVGELSKFRNAVLPLVAAIGGMIAPALIHFAFNKGTLTQAGFGIPMATDIAFALGILSLAGNRIPVSLKIFLTALAIIDDLGAILVIALFYTGNFSAGYFFAALGIFAALFIAGKFRIYSLAFYLVGGLVLWYCMLRSGVHATIAGVLLAFAIPYPSSGNKNPSISLQEKLHYPVAFVILPAFALANTAIALPANLGQQLGNANSLGIMLGLVAGKTTGIFFSSFLFVKTKVAALSAGMSWPLVLGASLLGGIGFTMSLFISNLAFGENQVLITGSKISILAASLLAAIFGLVVLKKAQRNKRGHRQAHHNN